jgi:hypothetical protein
VFCIDTNSKGDLFPTDTRLPADSPEITAPLADPGALSEGSAAASAAASASDAVLTAAIDRVTRALATADDGTIRELVAERRELRAERDALRAGANVVSLDAHRKPGR